MTATSQKARFEPATPARILVTGFGKFPGVRVNPTEKLMAAVTSRLRRMGFDAAGATFTVGHSAALRELDAAMETHRPGAVLMLGLASRARWIRVERYARTSSSALHPDAAGRAASLLAAASDRPLKATAIPEQALACLRRAGLRTRLSASAGRYLCNAAYAHALKQAAGRPILFIHVPWPRPHGGVTPAGRIASWRPRQAALVEALAIAGARLVAEARFPR
jgi:pyroglutamyl-peptidase